MPRRNLIVLLGVTVVALLCYQRVQKGRYGRVLAEAMHTIEKRYVEPVPSSQLFEAAVDGMVGTLDEHSSYIKPSDLKKFHETIDQRFVGVGMEVAQDPRTGELKVFSPLVDSPAFRAGIRAGDTVLRIGDDSTRGISPGDAVGLLRGKPGDAVTLTVLHEGQTKPETVRIVRETINAPTVRGDRRRPDGSWDFFLEGHDRIGYVRITSFTDETPDEFQEALNELTERGMRGLVLDLRDNPGGYLDAAIDVCDMLLDSGTIVTTRQRDGHINKKYTASREGEFTDFPMAVLINGQSASAAEIVAACLQDNRRAVVVGQRSYGKGSVQEIMPLEKGCGALKITTASYWRPSGKNIQRPRKGADTSTWGVSPDDGFKVPLGDEEENHWRVWRAHRDSVEVGSHDAASAHAGETEGSAPFFDRPLARAVEYVEKEAAEKPEGPE